MTAIESYATAVDWETCLAIIKSLNTQDMCIMYNVHKYTSSRSDDHREKILDSGLWNEQRS